MNEPQSMDLSAWELDERPANLVCPQCRKKRVGRVFKSWWTMAQLRGRDPPSWKVICAPCAEESDKGAVKPEPSRQVSEALELELPNTDLTQREDE